MNKQREVPIRIVRRKAHHSHHGGAWKVAMADFMTAMFALFLVLWLVNQSSDVKSAVAGYFQDPLGRASEFGSSILPGDGAQSSSPRKVLTPPDVVDLRRARLQQLAERVQERVDSVPTLSTVRQLIEIEMVEEGLLIQLLEDSTGVFFESGRATPSARGRELLALVGSELSALPNDVTIEGHTDARPYPGGMYTNWELSADRANMARRILVSGGLHGRQVAEIRGFADRDPRHPENPFAESNRRVAITVRIDTTKVVPAGAVGPAPARPARAS